MQQNELWMNMLMNKSKHNEQLKGIKDTTFNCEEIR